LKNGIFHAYGVFWRLDEIDWTPGKGAKKAFRLLGRQGMNQGTIKIADFRDQKGIYILYGNYGPHYVGLTKELGLGNRLKDHLFDKHKNKWDRFSWFSFGKVLKGKDADGLQKFGGSAAAALVDADSQIDDIEALLIQAMALNNVAKMNFATAQCWTQIKLDEWEKYLGKVRK